MVDLTQFDKWSLGKLFDHSVLPKNTQEKDIREGCKEAIQYNCAAFYSASYFWTPIVLEELAGTDILIGTGIDFPFGASPAAVKAFETERAVSAGCTSVDLVINVGALKDKRFKTIEQDLKAFKAAAGPALTKVILEVCFLTDPDIESACSVLADIGVDYAKTSTGQFERADDGTVSSHAQMLERQWGKAEGSRSEVPASRRTRMCSCWPAPISSARGQPRRLSGLSIRCGRSAWSHR